MISPLQRLTLTCLLATALQLAAPSVVVAQELTPRAFWPAPKGTKAVLVGYSHSTGDILYDPSLPVSGVDSKIHRGIVAYQQTLSLAGRTSNLRFELPYDDGSTKGMLNGLPASRSVSGFGDLRSTLSFNLRGAPTMNREEFGQLRASPRPILGASITVSAPTGEYDENRLINIGTNRWAGRFRLGFIYPFRSRWMLELGAGTWFFQDNDEFLGETRQQDPITAIDISLVHRFNAGFWVSADMNYYFGGRTTISGIASADFQRNSRAGLTISYPFAGRHAIRAAYSLGVNTDIGGDYETLLLTYVVRIN
jgi:hypothetical protein